MPFRMQNATTKGFRSNSLPPAICVAQVCGVQWQLSKIVAVLAVHVWQEPFGHLYVICFFHDVLAFSVQLSIVHTKPWDHIWQG